MSASVADYEPGLRQRISMTPDTVERDLARLVLTVVELLRQLMERQALRRLDEGGLTEAEEERVGMTLMLLDDRMSRLREHFGLAAVDRKVDQGPLGPLLPRRREADAHQAFRLYAETQTSAAICSDFSAIAARTISRNPR